MSRPCIIIDTREQHPYSFDPLKAESQRRALKVGDYSLAGLEDRVAVERKSLDDFVSTVIRSRRRFGAELRALRALDFACVVVEGGLGEVFGRRYRSNADPVAVLGAAISIIVDYGVPVFFCGDRQLACRFTQDLLLRFHKYFQEPSHAKG